MTWVPTVRDHDVRHRHGLPWYEAHVPYRWHVCRPQTVELRHCGGLLTGICHCACGAFTDRTGHWVGRNRRQRTSDPAGLRRNPRTPQTVRARVAADTAPHPGARRHPRFHPTSQPVARPRTRP